MDDDEGGPVLARLECIERAAHRRRIVRVVDVDDVPAIGFESLADVFGEGELGRAFDADLVAVVNPAQVGKREVSRDRGGLARDTLHHVAVAAQHPCVEIEQVEPGPVEAGRKRARGDRHADRIGAALAERTGGGLDAGGHPIFGMAGGLRAELAEGPDVVEADGGVPRRCTVRADLDRS